jgi:hypothetical protein
MNKIKAAEKSAQVLPNSEYISADISSEEWREVETSGGLKIRINNPVTLILRKGGKTHRVVDIDGIVHCYAAPETGHSVIRWKNKAGFPACRF